MRGLKFPTWWQIGRQQGGMCRCDFGAEDLASLKNSIESCIISKLEVQDKLNTQLKKEYNVRL